MPVVGEAKGLVMPVHRDAPVCVVVSRQRDISAPATPHRRRRLMARAAGGREPRTGIHSRWNDWAVEQSSASDCAVPDKSPAPAVKGKTALPPGTRRVLNTLKCSARGLGKARASDARSSRRRQIVPVFAPDGESCGRDRVRPCGLPTGADCDRRCAQRSGVRAVFAGG